MANAVFIEPMDEDEIVFIRKRYEKASKDYMRVMNIFLIACGIIPFVLGIIFALISNDVAVFIQVFIIGMASLTSFFIIVAVVYYLLQIYNKYRDTKCQTKLIERCMIIEKKSMYINNTFHFFLNSDVKYSIELSENDFNQYDVNDEINIEYSRYDKEYLGYF